MIPILLFLLVCVSSLVVLVHSQSLVGERWRSLIEALIERVRPSKDDRSDPPVRRTDMRLLRPSPRVMLLMVAALAVVLPLGGYLALSDMGLNLSTQANGEAFHRGSYGDGFLTGFLAAVTVFGLLLLLFNGLDRIRGRITAPDDGTGGQ